MKKKKYLKELKKFSLCLADCLIEFAGWKAEAAVQRGRDYYKSFKDQTGSHKELYIYHKDPISVADSTLGSPCAYDKPPYWPLSERAYNNTEEAIKYNGILAKHKFDYWIVQKPNEKAKDITSGNN